VVNNKYLIYILACIAGLIISFTLFPWLIFISLTPLLALYHGYKTNDISLFQCIGAITLAIFSSFLSISLLNEDITLIGAIVFGTLASGAFGLLILSETIIPNRLGLFTLIIYYTAMEYIALRMEPSLTGLILGSTLHEYPSIQNWSSTTGLTGVSGWILLGNVLFYPVIFKPKNSMGSRLIHLFYTLIILCIPVVISFRISSQALSPLKATEEILKHNSNPGAYPAEIFGRTCAWVAVFLLLYALVNLRIKKR
jgi:apolipoprotein N-acyltransferase